MLHGGFALAAYAVILTLSGSAIFEISDVGARSATGLIDAELGQDQDDDELPRVLRMAGTPIVARDTAVAVDTEVFNHARPAPRFVEQLEPEEIVELKQGVSERVSDDDSSYWFEDGPVTYRTMCVRLCDGAYFPVSFATKRERFARDEAICTSRCGSPSRLFVFRNGSGSPETMRDRNGRSYIALPTAFQFRHSAKPSCSCRAQPWEQASKDRHRLYALERELASGAKVDVAEVTSLKAQFGSPETVVSAPPHAASVLETPSGESTAAKRDVVTASIGTMEHRPELELPAIVEAAPTPLSSRSPVTLATTDSRIPLPATRSLPRAAPVGIVETIPDAVVEIENENAGAQDAALALSANDAASKRSNTGRKSRSKTKSRLAAMRRRDNGMAADVLVSDQSKLQGDRSRIWGVGRNSHYTPVGNSARDLFARNFY